MADKTEFLQAIDDAILDADSLERFINGSDDETVLTRLNAEYPTLQKAIKELFENNGIAGRFKTLVELQESELVNGDYALVADDADNNGIYIKEAGSWVKSAYDPLALAKKYTDAVGVIKLNKNLTDFTVKDIGISLVTGEEVSAPTFSSTGFTPVKSGSDYEYSVKTTAAVGGAWYNKDKVFISSFGSSLSGSEVVSSTAPEEAKYVRLTNWDSNSYPVFFRSVGYEYNKEELKRAIDDIDYDRAKNPLLELRYGGDYFTVADTYVHKGTGVTGALVGWSTTDYLKILPNTSYQIISGSMTTNSGFAWYDKNKEFIEGGAAVSLAKFTSPDNAVYIKMSADNRKKEISGLYSEQPSYNIEKLLDILDTHLDIDISSDSSGGGSDIAADTIVNSKAELQEVNPYGNSDRAYPIGRRVYDHSLRKEVIADGMFWRLPDGTAASLAPRVYVYPDWDEIRKALPYYAESYTPVYNVSQGVSAWTEGDNVKSVVYKGSKWLSITHSSGTSPYVILKDDVVLNNKYLIFDYWVDFRVTDNVRLGLFNTDNELLFASILSSNTYNGKDPRPKYDVEHLKIELDMGRLTPMKDGALLSDVSKIGFRPTRKPNEETTIYIGNIDCVSFKPKITIRFDDQWAGVGSDLALITFQ